MFQHVFSYSIFILILLININNYLELSMRLFINNINYEKLLIYSIMANDQLENTVLNFDMDSLLWVVLFI